MNFKDIFGVHLIEKKKKKKLKQYDDQRVRKAAMSRFHTGTSLLYSLILSGAAKGAGIVQFGEEKDLIALYNYYSYYNNYGRVVVG